MPYSNVIAIYVPSSINASTISSPLTMAKWFVVVFQSSFIVVRNRIYTCCPWPSFYIILFLIQPWTACNQNPSSNSSRQAPSSPLQFEKRDLREDEECGSEEGDIAGNLNKKSKAWMVELLLLMILCENWKVILHLKIILCINAMADLLL